MFMDYIDTITQGDEELKKLIQVVIMIGTTGRFKTSIVTAMFNPLGIINTSFKDIETSIRKIFQDCSIGITLINDYKI